MLRICYVEDEKAQELALKNLISQWKGEALLKVYQNGEAFLFEHENTCPFDLLILDIQLNQSLSGMDLARKVRAMDSHVTIIFLTNDPQYVFAGYEVAAARYFMKPVTADQLYPLLNELAQAQPKEKKYWIFSAGGEKVKLDTEEIQVVEVTKHYIQINTSDKTYETKLSLSEAQQAVDAEKFISPHRSYLVQLGKIRRITRSSVIMENGQEVPLSRNKYKEINEAFIRANL